MLRNAGLSLLIVKPTKKIQIEIASMAMKAMCFRTIDAYGTIMAAMGDPAVPEDDVLSSSRRAWKKGPDCSP